VVNKAEQCIEAEMVLPGLLQKLQGWVSLEEAWRSVRLICFMQ
jgi:hypothetical protein